MTRYAVIKYFGHFYQAWDIDAENEEEAWNRAEKDGNRAAQIVYKEEFPKDKKGYVKDMDAAREEDVSISEEEYFTWLIEAKKMGMVIRDYEEKELSEFLNS